MANLIGSRAEMFWTCPMGSLGKILKHSLSDQQTALTLILQVAVPVPIQTRLPATGAH